MKKFVIKSTSLILVIIMISTVLFACGSDMSDSGINSDIGNPQSPNYPGGLNGSESGIPGSEDEEVDVSITPIVNVAAFPSGAFPIFDGKAYTVKVVISDKANAGERQIATSLRNVLKAKTTANIAESTDYLQAGASYDPNAYEILIGETKHDESKNIYSSTSFNNYGIKILGKKLVMYFSSATEGEELVKSFTKAVMSNGKGLFWIDGNLSISNTISYQLSAVPKYSHGSVSTRNCMDNTSMVVSTGTNLTNFNKYCETLKTAGYAEYSTRENINGNYFRTYTKGSTAVTAYFSSGRSQARIIVGPIKDIPTKEKDTTPETVKPSLTMIGPSESTGTSLALIYQLANGKFLIIDGGFYLSDRIYKELKELQPNAKKFVIAGWFLSHPHVDHQEALEKFIDQHSHEVEIENLFFNYVESSYYDNLTASYHQSEDAKEGHSVTRFRELVAKKLSRSTTVIKPHTGQIYNFGSASVEIIATIEDFLPTKLDDINTSSLIVRVTVAGQSTMVLADATGALLKNVVIKMYNTHLKSDIVTLAHHGTWASTPEIYSKHIKASVLLWPTNTAGANTYYHKREGSTESQNAVKAAVNAATDIFLAGGTDKKLMLPYTPTGNRQNFINTTLNK